MVLPYLKGFDFNKEKHFYLIRVLDLGFILSNNLLYLQVRSLTSLEDPFSH